MSARRPPSTGLKKYNLQKRSSVISGASTGFSFPARRPSNRRSRREYEASQTAGMPVEYAKGVPLKGLEKTRSLRYPNQATFHPTKYLQGLVRCIQQRRGQLFADTAVVSVEEEDGVVVMRTEAGQAIRAKNAVIATNSPARTSRSMPASALTRASPSP